MSDKSSEEKTEDASSQKLKKARERGEISRSQSFAMVVATIGGFATLWMNRENIGERLSDFMHYILTADYLTISHIFVVARDTLIQLSMPVFIGAVISALLGNFFTNKGITFSMEKIKPQIQNLGFSSYKKRTFSMQGLSNFAQIMGVFVSLSSLMLIIIFLLRHEFFKIFQCGLICGSDFFLFLFGLFISFGLFITFVFGLIDLKVQGLLYLKQQRSTKTETKKELKEEMGEPHIRQERKRLHEAAAMAETLEEKLERTSFVIRSGGMLAAAIGYASQGGQNKFFLIGSARALEAERLKNLAVKHGKMILDSSEETLLALLGLEENMEINDSRILIELSKAILNAQRR